MKTLEQVYRDYKSETFDGRDLTRLMNFVPEFDLHKLGVELKDEYKGKHGHIPFTRENVLEQLEKDVQFGYGKARGMRGISSELMYNVVQMWNWILEEGLEDFDEYGSYGMPLFGETAKKYGWELD
ncbi:hypothetical protein BK133_00940 [Paenibacillus sp. FSL H8-0548]|uniref:hypothetical protein n=1 Tax=Paenibacillus sp. FSL H8-0548 TaxID=1920422 RepID=UPI00096E4159|nr:hypothetical protein [Paenibacillus sp. FSL H8-0548]OMF38800.1 hypothetical protein BK133_00940 [Paenibacillus sp. FSL H8-0548]